jgi:hypothetical protein
MLMSLIAPRNPNRRMSAPELRCHACDHTFALDALPCDRIDHSRPFVCQTLTPMYYCPIYRELPPHVRLRYNQLLGLFTNEVITFFEEHFPASVLGALLDDTGFRPLPPDLANCLRDFIAEEQKHMRLWRTLNSLAAPDWYAAGDYYILCPPPGVKRLVAFLTGRPITFPVVLWLMLLQEERSIDISRRCQRARDRLEPHFAAAYRAHLEEEVRHVQIDWHLIEHYYAGRRPLVRRSTAFLLRLFIDHFFLTPRRASMRIADLLIDEYPELAPLRPRMFAELRGLGTNQDYVRMMYSRQTTPIAFSLFDRFPEFRSMTQVLRSYRPPATEVLA